MKLRRPIMLLAVCLSACPIAFAGSIPTTQDSYYCAGDGYYYGDGLGDLFEIWELGSRVAWHEPTREWRLEFTALLDLPKAGTIETDTKGQNLLSPGDLWITVGSREPFAQGAGISTHAIGMATRSDNADYDPSFGGNIVRQEYPGQWWPMVTEGSLYKDAVPADGTFEDYEEYIKQQTPPCGLSEYWYGPLDPDHGDPLAGKTDDQINSYWSLIKDYAQELAGHSSVTWDDGTNEGYWYWNPSTGQDEWWYSYRVMGWVELDVLGLGPNQHYCLFLSSECGNDGAKHPSQVPEPAALLALAIGLTVARARRR